MSAAPPLNACCAGYKVRYLRLPDFFAEYAEAEARNEQLTLMKAYQKVRLLILDEFLLLPIGEEQQRIEAVASHGIPSILTSDQGSQFTSDDYKKLLQVELEYK